eukprot:m51a1_g9975 putative lipoprotein (684) ;mRNA; r:112061-114112
MRTLAPLFSLASLLSLAAAVAVLPRAESSGAAVYKVQTTYLYPNDDCSRSPTAILVNVLTTCHDPDVRSGRCLPASAAVRSIARSEHSVCGEPVAELPENGVLYNTWLNGDCKSSVAEQRWFPQGCQAASESNTDLSCVDGGVVNTQFGSGLRCAGTIVNKTLDPLVCTYRGHRPSSSFVESSMAFCTGARPYKLCGDGLLSPGEECEIGGWGCADNCKCKEPFLPKSPVSVHCTTKSGYSCGDGELDQGEECDKGRGCGSNCRCQSPWVPSSPMTTDCFMPPHCGDHAVNVPGEQCDGGAQCNSSCKCNYGYTPTSPASSDCVKIPKKPICGDGVMDAGEECELGRGCWSDCKCMFPWIPTVPATRDCVNPARCGDSAVNVPEEECDGGMQCNSQCRCNPGFMSTSPASKDCVKVPLCGDGVIDMNEDCEQGGIGCDNATCRCAMPFKPQRPSATKDCAIIVECGDGWVGAGEQCDSGVGCDLTCKCKAPYVPATPPTTDCTAPHSACGDGIVVRGEECDGGYGCNAACQCMPGWGSFGDGVSVNCAGVVCGDGVLQVDEQCERGGLGCDTSCQCNRTSRPTSPRSRDCIVVPHSMCGDHIIVNGEECDGGYGCSWSCRCKVGWKSYGRGVSVDCAGVACGDGVLQVDEQCERGGAGCNATTCQCNPGFKPQTPKSKQCVAL